MRESGFDTTFRFGPFSGAADEFAPVCLNSLLFRYKTDMEHFAIALNRPRDAKKWHRRSLARKTAISRYLWNEKTGMFVDYNWVHGTQSTYHYLSAYYPLWAGAATQVQATAMEGKLPLFETTGGMSVSDVNSGTQWDAPYGWAPTTWFAISGLDRNGFHEDAKRLAAKFSSTVETHFAQDGTVREKYDVVLPIASVNVQTGYKSNVIGFGWTNGVYLQLRNLIRK